MAMSIEQTTRQGKTIFTVRAKKKLPHQIDTAVKLLQQKISWEI
jgi:hypothetical protein